MSCSWGRERTASTRCAHRRSAWAPITDRSDSWTRRCRPLVALAVKLESRGSATFGHRRVGLNGQSFKCYKFRSMHPDAEDRLRSDPALCAEYLANSFKLPEDRDPRLTAVGRFLRKTSLDE